MNESLHPFMSTTVYRNGKFYDKKTGQGYFAFDIQSFYFFINTIVEVGLS